jgi:mono/diheme cytochrome c family protein
MRLRTTAEGQPPRDADLYATISLGSRGTPMPGFMTVLSSRERWQLVAYLRSLRSPPPAELATPSRSLVAELGQPPRDIVRRAHAPAKLLAGEQDHGSTARQLYARHCSGCHGTHGEVPYAGRNLLRPWMFRRGSSLADIALVISTGEAGAGMPGFFAGAARSHPSSYSNLDATSVWILAQHVGELAGAQPTPRSARQNDPGRDLGSPTQHHTLRARGWRYERLVDGMWVALDSAPITARSGELLHIRFQPLDNGRGTGQGLALTAHERALHIAGARVDHPSNITFRAGLPGHYTFYNPTASAPGHVLARMRGSFIVEALPQGSR